MNKLRTGTPVTVDGITLIPIERVRIRAEKQPNTYWFSITKEAVALVICDLEGPRAVDIDAHQRSVDQFITDIPGLASMLAECLPP